ncbi:hypothetical protein MMC17_002142 [Xylographa soralifera]|nr:hypothetical protein [Xylographa soralifera]
METASGPPEAEMIDQDPDPYTGFYNFSDSDVKIPLKYQPYLGRHCFWYRGRLFMLDRDIMQIHNSGPNPSRHEILKLTILGWSAKPIKDLIEVCRKAFVAKRTRTTAIFYPRTKILRRKGHFPWNRIFERPIREIDTITINGEQKKNILADINSYLNPDTVREYVDLGVPYRRGYLFHGPPGTGKTSFSFSVAGCFGLDIYCIPLAEPTLTEEDLGLLFNDLPYKCIVLLEDIDTAGLIKRTINSNTKRTGMEIEVTSLSRGPLDEDDSQAGREGISLSGLLNVIDGVAAPEGRVLIMTTNYPDKLDEALVRPGRIDEKLEFSMASRLQARDLFIKICSPAKERIRNADRSSLSQSTIEDIGLGVLSYLRMSWFCYGARKSWQHSDDNTTCPVIEGTSTSPTSSPSPEMQLQMIAEKFADSLPEGKFSPADIQGYLLPRRKEPVRALEDIESWVTARLKDKSARSC